MKIHSLPIVLALLGACLPLHPAIAAPDTAQAILRHLQSLPVAPASAAEVQRRCATSVQTVRQAIAAVESRAGPASLEADWLPFDRALTLLADSQSEMHLVSETHTDKAVREAAGNCVQELSALNSAFALSRKAYDRIAAIPQQGLDAATAFTLRKILIAYRIAGVEQPADVRDKVKALQERITATGLDFARNIREDATRLRFLPEDLKGVPQDFIDARKPDDDGRISLGLSYPEVFAVLEYAELRDTRRRMAKAFFNQGWPPNEAVVKQLLQQRYELARMLGYDDYATLVMQDKMIGTPARASDFLEDVQQAIAPRVTDEVARTLAFARQLDPAMDALEAGDYWYLRNKQRQAEYGYDSAQVRQYFSYDRSREGIFALVKDLFGADIRPWVTPVWHESVTAWSLHDPQGKLIGRFYLDMHPRDGKYTHAAQFPLRTGFAGGPLPVGVLVCNFPGEGPMQLRDVSTFLHEFGHLLHSLYSGGQRYGLQSMGNLQWDFIEAPSQLLEEWIYDYPTLASLSANPAGEPIPRDLFDKIESARHFGRGLSAAVELALSGVSLNFYNRAPDFDPKALYDAQWQRYVPVAMYADTHGYASFGHLDGYSAIYYTYLWSEAIALDLFTRFKAEGLRNPKTAADYRDKVLVPGASRDANQLIEDFLGRPMSLDAFREDLIKK